MDLSTVSAQDLKRLLELFPRANLCASWPEHKGTKEEICHAIVATRDYGRIGTFAHEHFSCCKQRVYVFSPPSTAPDTPPALIVNEQATLTVGLQSLFVLRVRYDVVLRKPLEEVTVDFLWPIRIDVAHDGSYALLRIVVLEKGVAQYFDRPCYVDSRSVEEKDVVAEVEAWANGRIDLHKGIKILWDAEFMDSSVTKVKKALSTSQETMDEEMGIRENDPELYGQIIESTIINALFAISGDEHGVSVFSVQPSGGYLAFPRYSKKGGTDHVISEILRNNQ